MSSPSADSSDLNELIFQSISDGVFTVDRNCIITSFNRAAEAITGFEAEQAVGKHCFDVFRTEVCHKQCALKDTLKNHDPVENARVTIITQEGCEVPISVSTTILHDESGRLIGGVEFFRDLTEVEHLRNRLQRDRSLESIVSADGYSYVFVVQPDNTVARRRIDTGAVLGDSIEVMSGVQGNELIVNKGAGFLKDGDLVNVSTVSGS